MAKAKAAAPKLKVGYNATTDVVSVTDATGTMLFAGQLFRELITSAKAGTRFKLSQRLRLEDNSVTVTLERI